MKVELSNYEIRAYRKGSGLIAFHHRSHLLVSSTVSFSAFAYVKNLAGEVVIPGNTPISFDEAWFTEWTDVRFDGRWQPIEFGLRTTTSLHTVKSCIVELTIRYHFDFHGSVQKGEHRGVGLLRRMFRR